jgi:integrase
MADATLRKNRFGIYQVRFRFGGSQYERSLGTDSRPEARDRLGAIRMALRHLQEGLLQVPEGVDVVDFILSGGKHKSPESAPAVPATRKKALTLGQAGERYLASFPMGGKESETLTTERIHFRHLTRILGVNQSLASLTRNDLQRFVNQRAGEQGRRGTVQRKTIKMELDTFRQIWDWAVDEGEVAGLCPMMSKQERKKKLAVRLPRGRTRETFKTWDEIQAILAVGVTPEREDALWECLFLDGRRIAELLAYVKQVARHPWIFPMFAFAAYTGARISEICRAQVEDVRFTPGKVLLREKKRSQEADTTREVPLAPELAAALREWLAMHPGGPSLFCKPAHLQKLNQALVPLTRVVAEKHFKLTLKGSRWARLHGWHLFRHSFASNLARSGRVSQAYIDELLGHQTEEMRRRYRHLFPEQIQGAVRVLSELYRDPVDSPPSASPSSAGTPSSVAG